MDNKRRAFLKVGLQETKMDEERRDALTIVLRMIPCFIQNLDKLTEEKYMDNSYGKKLREFFNSLLFHANELKKSATELVTFHDNKFGQEKIDEYLEDADLFTRLIKLTTGLDKENLESLVSTLTEMSEEQKEPLPVEEWEEVQLSTKKK